MVMRIVFTRRANERLTEVADYLYRQHCSKKFVVNYIRGFRDHLKRVLIQFPESGTLVPEYGEDIRRIICKEYSFLYQIRGNDIEILTVFRENLA